MTEQQTPNTFLEKIEKVFEDLKNELEGRLGVHVAILDGIADAKMGTLTAAAEHFGEPADTGKIPVAVPTVDHLLNTSTEDNHSDQQVL